MATLPLQSFTKDYVTGKTSLCQLRETAEKRIKPKSLSGRKKEKKGVANGRGHGYNVTDKITETEGSPCTAVLCSKKRVQGFLFLFRFPW